MTRVLNSFLSAGLICIFLLPTPTLQNPYAYYGSYSRSRRDPAAAWQSNYGNRNPIIPSVDSGYPGGGIDNQRRMGVAAGYGGNMYGSMGVDNPHNPRMGGLDSQSQQRIPADGVQSPLIPNVNEYAGRNGNQLRRGVSAGYGVNPYGSMSADNSRNPPVTRLDSSQHVPAASAQNSMGLADHQQARQEEASEENCGEDCGSLENCINVDMNDTACCPKCVQYGCVCKGYQIYDCEKNGFSNGMLPEGKSYMVAGGTTVCSCPPGGGSIMCSFKDPTSSECPDLPPNCIKEYVRDIDGCSECAMLGCSEDGLKVELGMTVNRPPCSTCYCPPTGGQLICGTDPTCSSQMNGLGTDTRAMQSSLRVINSFGSRGESDLYGSYSPYPGGNYPDYGLSDNGAVPAVPPIAPVATDSESQTDEDSKTEDKKKPTDAEGTYNSMYQQRGQGMYYPDPYSYRGLGGQYPDYFGGYGKNPYMNGGFGDRGSSLPSGQKREDEPSDDASAPSKVDKEASRPLYPTQRQDGGQYGVPALANPGYPAYPDQGGQGGDDAAETSKNPSAANPTANGFGYPGVGYPYVAPNQAGYFSQGGNFGYQQGYPFQPAVEKAPQTAEHKGTQSSKDSDDESTSDSGSQPRQTGTAQESQPFAFNNPRYSQFGSYGSQNGYPYQQGYGMIPGMYGSQQVGQDKFASSSERNHGSSDQNSLVSAGKQGRKDDGFAEKQGPNFPERDPIRNAGQFSPPLTNPHDSRHNFHSEATNMPPKNFQDSSTRQSRRIRDHLSVVNKGRFSHELRPHHHEPSPTATASSTTIQRKITRFTSTTRPPPPATTRPTTTTTTAKPTTTTTTTTRPTTTTTKPTTTTTTTTTTRPTTTTTTTTKPKTTKSTTTTTSKPRTTPTTTATTTTTRSTTKKTTTTEATIGKNAEGSSSESYERELLGCCSRGRIWAKRYNTCRGITRRLGEQSELCFSAQKQCCLETNRQELCQSGINVAHKLGSCNPPAHLQASCDGEEFTSCCSCCGMGLKARELGMSCTSKLFSQSCGTAYTTCCEEGKVTASEETDSISPRQRPTTSTTTTTTTTTEATTPRGPRCSTHSSCQQLCNDTPDGMVCSCRRGYRLRKDGTTCVDVNECVLETHTCTENQLCLNRQGSFFCQRRLSCGTGYELTARNTCEDIDECTLGLDDCLQNTDCENIRGSYRCIPKLCEAGFITDATGQCIDINECRSRDFTCPIGASCINTRGSYVCKCPTGLRPNEGNIRCEDVDECQMGLADCSDHAICVNTIGSYICREKPKLSCAHGFEPNEDMNICVDVDECTAGTHSCESGSTCINENGGFRCQDPLVCPTGMEANEEERKCVDINECRDPALHRCQDGGRCLNLVGSYKCICNEGYKPAISEEGLPTCKDIDECETTVGRNCQYKCRNLPGSYECFCPEGYKTGESSNTCEDIDECSAASSPCSSTETCFNTHGSHKCVNLACPTGYKKYTNTRCSRLPCRGQPRSCLKQPKQISYHNISISNGTKPEKPLFRMSVARTTSNSRYKFVITSGNEDGVFKVRTSSSFRRPSGVVYTAQKLLGPKEYIVDLTLNLIRGRRQTTYISKLYIFVGAHDL